MAKADQSALPEHEVQRGGKETEDHDVRHQHHGEVTTVERQQRKKD